MKQLKSVRKQAGSVRKQGNSVRKESGFVRERFIEKIAWCSYCSGLGGDSSFRSVLRNSRLRLAARSLERS